MSEPRLRRVTIRDVALEAGVSPSTVSNWLSRRSKHMAASTEAAVALAAEKLGYRPQVAARVLRGQSSRVLGVIVPSIMNPSFPAIVRGADDRAAADGYSLFLGNIDRHQDKAVALTQAMIDRGVDGVAFAFSVDDASQEAVVAADRSGLRTSLLVPKGAGTRGHRALVLDNEAAMRQVVGHLWGLGHRRIGVATNSHMTANAPHRVSGLAEALRARKGGLPRELVFNDTASPASFDELAELEIGRRAGLSLLTLPSPPTAICAVTDSIAVGLVRAARELGLGVPDDISVVGFGDLPASQVIEPALTTVALDLYAIGQSLVELLLEAEV
ncbi:MAG TPA: LacI family DNA-binding transcriptional regulator, partial [Acidimicrobiales bacterium]|nr:LacI family DNA-binding transcriptional regulator [Acidimicrobiales bacterium]